MFTKGARLLKDEMSSRSTILLANSHTAKKSELLLNSHSNIQRAHHSGVEKPSSLVKKFWYFLEKYAEKIKPFSEHHEKNWLFKSTLGGVSLFISGFIADAFWKNRSEALDRIKMTREYIDKHWADAQDTFKKLEDVEIIPRLGVYTQASEEEIQKNRKISKDLQGLLKENELLTKRISEIKVLVDFNFFGLISKIKPTIRVVAPQKLELLNILKQQRIELRIVIKMNEAAQCFKLKQIEKALSHSHEALKMLETLDTLTKHSLILEEKERYIRILDSINDKKQEVEENKTVKYFMDSVKFHAHILRGKLYYHQGFYNQDFSKFENARKELQDAADVKKAESEREDEVLSSCYRAYVLTEQGCLVEAVKLHLKSSKINSGFNGIFEGLGFSIHMLAKEIKTLCDGGKIKELQKLLNACIEEKNDDHKSIFEKLNVYVHLSKKLDANEKDSMEELVKCLYDLALGRYSRALQLKAKSPYALALNGTVLLDKVDMIKDNPEEKDKLLKDALANFEKSIIYDYNPHYPLATLGRARALIQLNIKYEQAREDLNSAKSVYENWPTPVCFKVTPNGNDVAKRPLSLQLRIQEVRDAETALDDKCKKEKPENKEERKKREQEFFSEKTRENLSKLVKNSLDSDSRNLLLFSNFNKKSGEKIQAESLFDFPILGIAKYGKK